jgi:glyceraldehyde-3-phosphate dehydrogenase (NADP+)
MSLNRFENFYPTEEQIPSEYNLTEPIEQREYLVNGEMRAWAGKTQDVWSPIYIQTPEGLVQKRIGSYPITEPSDAMETLDAAVGCSSN